MKILRLVLLTVALAALASAADISGKWQLTVETEQGTREPKLDVKQDGEKLTGTYTGQLGEAKVTGSVKGDAVEFSLSISPQGEAITLTYTGKVESATRMTGKVVIGSFGEGKWTAVKDK